MRYDQYVNTSDFQEIRTVIGCISIFLRPIIAELDGGSQERHKAPSSAKRQIKPMCRASRLLLTICHKRRLETESFMAAEVFTITDLNIE
jgi:hypothetical protein